MNGNEKRKASLGQAVAHRNYQRARNRALARLSRAYQDEYKRLLEEEKAVDEALGKKWVGIDTNSGVPITAGSGSSNQGGTHSSNEGENQSNDGGEA